MQKLFNADLLDIVPLERGFTYACRETLPEGGDAVMAVSYMKRKLAGRARYVSLAQNRTERNTEEQTVRVPIRRLWQRNGVMNC